MEILKKYCFLLLNKKRIKGIMTIESIIDRFNLLPHPEGGFYKETYRAAEKASKEGLPSRFRGDRSFSTAIYFLIPSNNFSAFHKIESDELWHFYAGGSLLVHVIHPNGLYELMQLGNDIEAGESFQAVVPAGAWFASEPAEGVEYSFVGCTVAPGFDFADFILAKSADLMQLFPQHSAIINRLCRE